MSDDILQKLIPHGIGLTEEVEARIHEALPHFMWTWKEGRKKFGVCSRCWETRIPLNKEAMPGGTVLDHIKRTNRDEGMSGRFYVRSAADKMGDGRHGSFIRCPMCGAVVMSRSLAISRTGARLGVFLVRYARSESEPGAIVMTLWQAREIWETWNEWCQTRPDMDCRLIEVCVFRPGTACERYCRDAIWCADWEHDESGCARATRYYQRWDWKKRRQCISGFVPGTDAIFFWALDADSLRDALEGTPQGAAAKLLGVLDENSGDYYDRITSMRMLYQYPCVELLAKFGFDDLARKVLDREAGGVLNLRGKTAQKVLRITGDDWGWIKGHKIKPDLQLLRLMQTRTKLGLRLGNDWLLAQTKANYRTKWDAQDLGSVCRLAPKPLREKMIRWAQKRRITTADYIDHLSIMRDLGMDMQDSAVTMPKDFPEMHARLAARIKVKHGEIKEKKLRKWVDSLGIFRFSALGLTLRPMDSAEEVIREGTVLRHCVASYATRYAQGQTVLLCLREDTALDTPLYTVEYSNAGHRVQCRGYKNQIKPEDEDRLALFWKLYDGFRAEYQAQHGEKKKRRSAA